MIRKSPTYLHWLKNHEGQMKDYLNNYVDIHSRKAVSDEFWEFPALGYHVVKDWMVNREDPGSNVNKLLNYIRQPGVFVVLVVGMPDSGKTTTAYKIAELLRDEYNIKYVAPLVEEGALPEWIDWISSPHKLLGGDLAIVDEAAIQFSARRSSSKSNVEGLVWLAVGRHVGAKVIYITQISSLSDINISRMANIIISKGYGTSALGSSQIERSQLADNPILQYLNPETIEEVPYALLPSNKKDWAVTTIHKSTFMCYIPKPKFMTDRLSRSYRRYIERANGDREQAEKMAMGDAKRMRDDGLQASIIYTQMSIRGFFRPLREWEEFTGERRKARDDYEYV